MFLHLSVILFTEEGVSVPVHAGIHTPHGQPPSSGQTTPLLADTPLHSAFWDTLPICLVNARIHPPAQCMLGWTWLLLRMLHILLECILVINFFEDLLIGNDYITSHTTLNISMLLVKRCESIIGTHFEV